MPNQETSLPPFDPEKFRTEFVDCLTPDKPAEKAIQMMTDVIQRNPDRIDEICKIASTAFRAMAQQHSLDNTEKSHEIKITPEEKFRSIFKEILHYILRRIKEDSFKRDMDQLGRKSPWAGMASWLIVEQCENGLGLRDKHMKNIAELSTKLLVKEGADDIYGPYCGIQVTIRESKPDSKLHGFIIVKLVRVGDEDIVEISSCSVDKFATVVGPTKDTIENHGGDYRIYNIGDINPDEWDVVDKKTS